MKNVHRVSTKQHGIMKSGVLWFENATILQARTRESLTIPTDTNMWLFWHVFVAATVKLQEFVMKKLDFSPSEQGRLACLYPWHIVTSALRLD